MKSAAVAVLALSLALVLVAADAPESAGTYAHEAVATDHAEASAAALAILARGGSAADAAAAAMLVLGVANPSSSGFGGGGFALYYRASDRTTTFLDFRERAPGAATPTMFEDREREHPGSRPSRVGGLAVGVPGEPAGIEALVRRFGRLPLRVDVAPAMRLARRGVVASRFVRSMVDADMAASLASDPLLRRFVGEGRVPEGALLRQPRLAEVLARYAARGSRAVYEGPIARRIVRDVRAHGGILREADLADYRVRERAPLREQHFGHEWVTAPPPSAGGATMLASLDFLERAGIGRDAAAVDVAHALAESWKGPYLDRQEAFGDPDHVDVPIDVLTSEARRAARFARFDPSRARPSAEYAIPLAPPSPARTPDGGGTSHLCIVDREGNVASVTTTVNLGFGARFTAGGVLMNDEMDDFALAVGATNAFGLVGGERNRPGPGRRPVSSMTPTIVFDGRGVPVLCVGASGGSRIPTATEQVAIAVIVFGADVADAVAAPRTHHQAVPDVLRSEDVAPAAPTFLAALEARGHVLGRIENVAHVQAIARRPDGSLRAASDPRKGGRAAGR